MKTKHRGIPLDDGPTLVSFHSHGDVDAVCSAIALSRLLKHATTAAPDKLNSRALKLLQRLGWPMQLAPGDLSKYQRLILVDASSLGVFGEREKDFAGFGGERIAIDHHYHSHQLKGFKLIIDREASSACEMVYEMYVEAGRRPAPEIALLLACGIYADSACFRSATTRTMMAFAKVLEISKASYREIVELVEVLPSAEERRVVLDAVGKCHRVESNGQLLGWTETKAFDSAVAAALVAAGCGVGVAVNRERGALTCVKHPLLSGFNCGKAMEAAGDSMQGQGGGHENAGGCNGEPSKVDQALNTCITLFKKTA